MLDRLFEEDDDEDEVVDKESEFLSLRLCSFSLGRASSSSSLLGTRKLTDLSFIRPYFSRYFLVAIEKLFLFLGASSSSLSSSQARSFFPSGKALRPIAPPEFPSESRVLTDLGESPASSANSSSWETNHKQRWYNPVVL